MTSPCKNCSKHHEQLPDVCLVAALLGLSLHSRCEITVEEARERAARLDADLFWEELGPIVDKLQDGYFDFNGE